MQKLLFLVIIAAILGTGSYVIAQNGTAGAPGGLSLVVPNTTPSPTPSSTPVEQPMRHDIDTPSSITVVVNKQRPLPLDYKADDLFAPSVPLRQSPDTDNMQVRRVMEVDLVNMIAAADAAGLKLSIGSAYRSAETQRSLYNGYVATSGQVFADLTSARPGFSEHQTGLAIDFINSSETCFLEKCFADTAEGAWLAANAHMYGFVLRYPLNKTAITGYDFEPWHYRYVGQAVAEEVHASGITLEEYFSLPAAPDY